MHKDGEYSLCDSLKCSDSQIGVETHSKCQRHLPNPLNGNSSNEKGKDSRPTASQPGRRLQDKGQNNPRMRRLPRSCARSRVRCDIMRGFIVDSKGPIRTMRQQPKEFGRSVWLKWFRGENSQMPLWVSMVNPLDGSWRLENVPLRRAYIRCTWMTAPSVPIGISTIVWMILKHLGT